MTRGRLAVLILGFLILGLSGGMGYLNHLWSRTSGPDLGDTLLVIEPGESSRQIARGLERSRVIDSSRHLLWRVRLFGEGGDLQAGRYLLPRPCSIENALDILTRGETEKIWLTIPEGLWLTETVSLISSELGLDSLDLARRVNEPDSWPYPYLRGRDDLEGFLMPDTYAFEYPVRAEDVLDNILANFNGKMGDLLGQAPPEWNWSVVDWVTLASIVEAEAALDSERPQIAAVYLNRIRKGMRLEADPTVIYGLGFRKKRLYYKDLQKDSPYNTYRNGDLPPGPICSPGIKSLAAIFEAEPADSNLYFVAAGGGGHLFSHTLAQHRKNVRMIRSRKSP